MAGLIFDFNEPNTRAGCCPECRNDADIYCSRDGVWHCRICNWMGVRPSYEVHPAEKERREQMRNLGYA